MSKEELRNLINLSRVYIIEEDKELIGWLRYNLFWDSIPFMNMLYILEAYRKKGYGRKLVLYWEENMKKLGHKLVMTSTVSREYSQHFYNKLGYTTIGGFTLLNEPYEIIMEKVL
ncbi:GNAT family N-acetyltransferase [Miniphocaeibacter halophilus]|uniref:GNAT family N-acetyltransferase n=1 Tax=Miniphocaeibacter halophilus TaxID=2931922 RepID=UPI0021E106A8|nr:GNAT family N-acetyltransferase [Miniphocaeibacter halophilus]